jgi:GNAT superfamily N-acetyltransferase
MIVVRDLLRTELSAAAQLLARGMRDDPMHCVVFGPDPAHRQERLGRFFGGLLPALGYPALSAWEDDRLVGVLALFPPGNCHPSLLSQVRIACPLLTLNFGELSRLRRWFHASEERDLRERHWHLGPVAVDRHLQGQGIGSQMLQVLCRKMDALGEVGFLETDKFDSVRFYARGGFEIQEKAELFGTPNWWMRRPVDAPFNADLESPR